MKDLYEVLRQKEIDLDRVRQEVNALELIIPLVEENGYLAHGCQAGGGEGGSYV